jgi:hypothetical protein
MGMEEETKLGNNSYTYIGSSGAPRTASAILGGGSSRGHTHMGASQKLYGIRIYDIRHPTLLVSPPPLPSRCAVDRKLAMEA